MSFSSRVSTTSQRMKSVTPGLKLQLGIRLLHATLAASLLVLSNDVSLNPGPKSVTAEPASQMGKSKCASCNKTIRRNLAAILCSSCALCLHAKCLGLSRNDINRLKTSTEQWICLACSLPTVNDSFFESPNSSLDVLNSSNCMETDNSEILETLSQYATKYCVIGSLNINSLSGKFSEV